MEKRGLSNHQGSTNNIATNSMFDRQAAVKNHKIQSAHYGTKLPVNNSRTAAIGSTRDSGGGDATKIHSLYQDLYLTDLKNDLGEVEGDLSKEKERSTHL